MNQTLLIQTNLSMVEEEEEQIEEVKVLTP